jgi:argininosuccinate lyase
MEKMWAGRTDGKTEKAADDFNSSIRVDSRMYREDIEGSIAHASMLARQGIITPEEAAAIIGGLNEILDGISSGKIEVDNDAEDVHMFVERLLTEKIGDAGKKLHTARSRNDQVALDSRMYSRNRTKEIICSLKKLIAALCGRAEEYKSVILPGYTHLQRAQPVTFGHHLMAYAMMFLRDTDRLTDALKRVNVSPIGSCALAGTTYDTDRKYEAELLGFDGVCLNSIDGVSDRDFCVELAADIAIVMMHLSRMAEELVLWSSWEFGFISLSDGYTTGSSIMPQKKNPDMAELVRGKTGRVYGDLVALLTLLKGLPLAYNKDMQEDKENLFDAFETALACLEITTGMISTMTARPDRMRAAAGEGFINATDLADYLVGRGLPFRDAYKISGRIVAYCIENRHTLETLPLEKYREFCGRFDEKVYEAIDLDECVKRRISEGGTSVASVEKQIKAVREKLEEI